MFVSTTILQLHRRGGGSTPAGTCPLAAGVAHPWLMRQGPKEPRL